MATKKTKEPKPETIKDIIKREGLEKDPEPATKKKKKPTAKKAPVKKVKKDKSPVPKTAEEEIMKMAEEYEEAKSSDLPDIVLPPRGFFMKGDTGANVEALQQALNTLIDANIPIDGKLQSDTVLAVEKFEQQYGGFPNGKFGSTELDAYNKVRGK